MENIYFLINNYFWETLIISTIFNVTALKLALNWHEKKFKNYKYNGMILEKDKTHEKSNKQKETNSNEKIKTKIVYRNVGSFNTKNYQKVDKTIKTFFFIIIISLVYIILTKNK